MVQELGGKRGVSGGAPGGVGAGGGGDSADAGSAEEQTEFDVVLISDGGKKIGVIMITAIFFPPALISTKT